MPIFMFDKDGKYVVKTLGEVFATMSISIFPLDFLFFRILPVLAGSIARLLDQ